MQSDRMEDNQGLEESEKFYNAAESTTATPVAENESRKSSISRARTSESEMTYEGLETVSLDASTDAGLMSIQLNAPLSIVSYDSKTQDTEEAETTTVAEDTVDRAAISQTTVTKYFEATEQVDVSLADPKTFFDSLSAGLSPMMKSVADITLLDDKESIEVAVAAHEEESATLSFPEAASEDKPNATKEKTLIKKQSLQSLFNEDKFGSDVVGKAFFDSLAGETGEVTSVSDSDKGKSELSTEITIQSQHQTPVSSPESFFSESLEKDCYYDAWIPSKKTQTTLRLAVTSPPGTYFPDKTDLTMPGIIIEDFMDDPVKLLLNDLNLEEAKKRQCLTADNVSQDDKGLLQLIGAKCYHAAINLTQRLISSLGQGPGKGGHPTKHSPYSLQLWLTRLALFIKLRKFAFAEVESAAFSDLDKPDIYYEFYPDTYPGKKGSMASFSFRILLAGLPQHQGNYHGALDRLYALLTVIRKIIENLNKGLAEDGSMMELPETHRKASIKLWQNRECRTMYSILNCMIAQKDYIMAIKVAKSIMEKDKAATAELYGTLGKIYLQLGDIHSANECFTAISRERANQPATTAHKVEELINKALMCIVQNGYADAYKNYNEAYLLDPKNSALANNMAVCLLYMGKLKDSLTTLERTITANPKQCLHEGILFNTCILYELESTNSVKKKEAMLKLAAEHSGDAFQTNCLKIDSSVRGSEKRREI